MFSFFETNNENTICIPKSKLGYSTNNQYSNIPPKMQDGRSLISSWQPETIANSYLLKKENIKSNWEYRKYLTQNAKDIMKVNFLEACNDTGYVYPTPQTTTSPSSLNTIPENANHPFSYKSFNDNTQPFGYQDSDLKQIYLTREQLNAKKVVPVINTP